MGQRMTLDQIAKLRDVQDHVLAITDPKRAITHCAVADVHMAAVRSYLQAWVESPLASLLKDLEGK